MSFTRSTVCFVGSDRVKLLSRMSSRVRSWNQARFARKTSADGRTTCLSMFVAFAVGYTLYVVVGPPRTPWTPRTSGSTRPTRTSMPALWKKVKSGDELEAVREVAVHDFTGEQL